MTTRLVECDEVRHSAAMLAIINEVIASSTAIYDFNPRAAATMIPWFAVKRDKGFPIVGVENDHGALMGFASYGTFRQWAAYKYSVEHSLYVHHDHRGKGLGRLLLNQLLMQARQRDVHTIIGGIDAANASSIALHVSAGFDHAGTIKQAGFKFGRWLDLAFYQRVLDTPREPNED